MIVAVFILLRNQLKKMLFTLIEFQGEYVDCEKIENLYLQSQYVAQAFVRGDPLKVCVLKYF